ncbi:MULTISPECIES: caspase family protein [unclassified Micromonospora]|uniref:caspase family protein n=1 Tax=unclassified Micromonospora TaxID=2617518 RepID=UPI0033DE3A92
MSSLYALLVGINSYRAPGLSRLSGCHNDVGRVEQLLDARFGSGPKAHVRTLLDEQATRAAVVAVFREHLGQAGPGDTALFWFSGHGSRSPLPPELWYREPSGWCQTLVCHDSRAGGTAPPDLLDCELRVLISEVAARGAHVAVVLDSCHSAGATRTGPSTDPQTDEVIRIAPVASRWAEPATRPPALESLLPELVAATNDAALGGDLAAGSRDVGPDQAGVDHVALTACRDEQQAYETGPWNRRNGIFTLGLLDAIERLGPGATYRELMVAARCAVENARDRQVPTLYPADHDIVDQPFLGGAFRAPAGALVMRFKRGSWEINAGSIHGIKAAAGDDVRVAVHLENPVREARVTRVRTEVSVVEPLGWTPDTGRQYDVVLSRVPMPAVTVAVGGTSRDEPETARAVIEAMRNAGPGGSPSPHLRVVPLDGSETMPDLRVSTGGGRIRVLSFDGTPLTDDLTRADVHTVVDRLEHLARWRTIRNLANPVSRLADAVKIEVVAAEPGEISAPRDRAPYKPGDDGAVLLTYARAGDRWAPPMVFIRLRNTSDRPLYCVLLDLTDRHAVHPHLFPGRIIAPGNCGAAFDGGLVAFQLPEDRAVEPGAETRDYLQLLVSEEEFPATSFHLGALGTQRAVDSSPSRSGSFTGILDRLGMTALHREAVRPPAAAPDWASSVLTVRTRVPEIS